MSGREATIALLLIVVAFILGWVTKPDRAPEARVEERTDTLWRTVHDTTFVATERKVERLDTILLARVDTILTTDSVYVEVPIEEQTWKGENYKIVAEGFRMRLKDVYVNVPTIEKTITNTITKRKHWGVGVGIQAGYGATIHGMSPYAGVGVQAGYTF